MEIKKLVSVIVPTKNSERAIARCLISVKNQTYHKIEIINIDNNSTDKTKEIARKYAKVYNKGPERTFQRNFGAKKARGEYLFFIDSDMELTPNIVKECVKLASKYDAIIIEENNIGSTFWSRCRSFEKKMYIGDEDIVAARFFRKKVFESLGGYDEELLLNEDISLHQTIKSEGYKIGRIKSFLNHYEDDTFIEIIRTSFFYGQSLHKFMKKHPLYGVKYNTLSRLKAYAKNWRLFLKEPIYGAGSVIRKFIEYIFAFAGMMYYLIIKPKNKRKR